MLDKIAIAAEVIGYNNRELEQRIVNYAVELKQSPFMRRFLREQADTITREIEDDS